MNSDYTVYRLSDGLIDYIASCPDSHIDIQIQPGCGYILGGSDSLLQYVDVSDPENPAIADKTLINYAVDNLIIDANGVDMATITGLPEGAVVDFFGTQSVTIDATGETDFGTDVPGEYTIVITHPMYLDTQITITAEALP